MRRILELSLNCNHNYTILLFAIGLRLRKLLFFNFTPIKIPKMTNRESLLIASLLAF